MTLFAQPREVPAQIARVLAGWLPQQRWWPGDCAWQSATAVDLADNVTVWLLRTAGGITVQVPLVLREDRLAGQPASPAPPAHGVSGSPDGGRGSATTSSDATVVSLSAFAARTRAPAPPGLIGTAQIGTTRVQVIDATHDPAFHRALLRNLRVIEPWAGAPTGPLLISPDEAPSPAPDRGVSADVPEGSIGAVLGVEQSNTSIIMPRIHGGIIVKVMRNVVDGAQPDLDVPNALAAAGFAHVPRTYAVLESGVDDGRFIARWTATLAIVSQLVPEAEDGFTRACAMAASGIDFARDCRSLGADLADMHGALRRAFPVGIETAHEVLNRVAERIDHSASGCGFVAELLGPIDTFLDALRRDVVDEPVTVQRLHGDLHLGQTLHSPFGWWVLDFEGEPLRPLSFRLAPDLPLRDLAGMLRSIDYAAALADAPDPGWRGRAREALLQGYADNVGPLDPRQPHPRGASADALLTAFELEKACYEVGYEMTQRPQWAWVPQDAVNRILGPFL